MRNEVLSVGNNIISIPDFTKEEYFDTSLPYDFLYQYKDDKFLLNKEFESRKSLVEEYRKTKHFKEKK